MALGYAWFAPFYDLALERLYRETRRTVVGHLEPTEDASVLVVACGTGQDFPHLLEHLGPNGRILGVDFSPDMLARTPKDPRITTLEADAALLTREMTGRVDRILITLGLTVIPEWQAALEAAWELLEPGGRITIFDVHAERWVPQTTMVEFMAGADMYRKVFEPLVARGGSVTWLPGSPHIHGGRMFVASADKPN